MNPGQKIIFATPIYDKFNPASQRCAKISKLLNSRLFFIFLLFIIQCSLFITKAQQPTQEWVARYTGPFNDLNGPFLQVDKYGNSYLAGTHVIGQSPNDSICILCVKYNSSGVQLWATLYRYPGEGYFAPYGIALDTSGNAYVIADYGPGYTSPLNGLIVKFNSSTGSPVWAGTYVGQYGSSSFDNIKIDRFNNIYVVGASDSYHLVMRYNTNGDSIWARKYHPLDCSEGFGACTIDDSLNIISTGTRRHFYFSGSYDSVLIAKYSSSGDLRWESTYSSGLTTANWGSYITSDQNGNVYVGGGTTPSGYAVFLTLKYDRNGVQQWVSIYDAPGSGDNNLRGIAMDRINNALFVTGSAVNNAIQMATTIKYNSVTGDSLWIRNDTGTYKYGDSRAIKIDALGNSYVTGVSSSTGSGAPVDIMTLKYMNNGIRAWITTYNGPFGGLDIGRDLALDTANNVYVLGTSQSSSQISDYVVIKYNQLSGIRPINGEIPMAFNLKQNYPNPFNPSTKIRFTVSRKSFVELRIYDILGRLKELALSQYVNASEYELTLDGSGYASGTYFYQLMADGRIIETKKMIVLK